MMTDRVTGVSSVVGSFSKLSVRARWWLILKNDKGEDLEDIVLAGCRPKDAKTKENRAELAAKESEIL